MNKADIMVKVGNRSKYRIYSSEFDIKIAIGKRMLLRNVLNLCNRPKYSYNFTQV